MALITPSGRPSTPYEGLSLSPRNPPLNPRKLFPHVEPPKQKMCLKRMKHVVLNPDSPAWINTLGSLVRAVKGVIAPFFTLLKKVQLIIAATQFSSALTMPFDLFSLTTGIAHVATHKKHCRLDNALGIFGDATQLGDGIGNFTAGLADLGAVSNSVMNWVAPLSLACALASSVFFVIHGRGLYYNNLMLKELKTALNKGSSAAIKVVKKRSFHLDKHCGVETDIFLKTIRQLKKRERGTPVEQEQELSSAYGLLKRRILQKKVYHALGIIITSISIIASIILFATILTPFGIAASGLLAATCVLSMSKMAFETYSKRRFKRGLRSPLLLGTSQ
jgi:hypothetical protein